MPLSWNEINSRALAFSREWHNDTSEDAEAKSFWDAFFDVFGVPRRRVAGFELAVKKLDGKQGFIDLLWKGVILVEHKSRGRDLDSAFMQALGYLHGLKDSELPKYILVSDFARFRLYDLEDAQTGAFHEFPIAEFVHHVDKFAFLAGYQKRVFKDEDPVNIEAAQLMGKLHDRLRDCGFAGHDLEMLLTRLLFCMFAEDTAIFEKHAFLDFVETRTSEDGTDLGAWIAQIFQTLNTPPEKRMKTLDEQIRAFPYVNGGLFRETIQLAQFDRTMRETLIECCYLDWSRISPAIFGSLFQAAMNPTERRALGAHYTSEKNILKALNPLFLDTLRTELGTLKALPNNASKRSKLDEFHRTLGTIRIFDPACGCGNFLIVAYRELRRLELGAVREMERFSKSGQIITLNLLRVSVGQFTGIELEEFPARIAEVAMWLIDHQMNLEASLHFGQYYTRLPITEAAHIVHANALRTAWEQVLPPSECSYIVGNPPFVGKHLQSAVQTADMTQVFAGVRGAGNLDFVTAWYKKAAQYIAGNSIKAAFVSTNSISQGEQVGVLWGELFKHGMALAFAHRTFKWTNEAPGKAAVHCVIIGFAAKAIAEAAPRLLYEYDTPAGEPHVSEVPNISPYLIPAGNTLVQARSTPLCNVPEMIYGNKPVDGGFLFLTPAEKAELLAKEPQATKFIRRIYGSDEFINNIERYCLWLKDAAPQELRAMPLVMQRIEGVKQMRLESTKQATVRLAATPTLFAEIRQPDKDYLLVPLVSSETRPYIPIGFMPKEIVVNNLASIIPNATLYHFGVLSSLLHMAWVKYVCGRLESRYRYSNTIVYNNFPWAESPTDAQRQAVERAAQAVLDARLAFPSSSLADLYDPLTMPPALTKAHQNLDKAVDRCYRAKAFNTEQERIGFLFALYERYCAPLTAGLERVAAGKAAKKSKKSQA
jgi:hypothetical protein